MKRISSMQKQAIKHILEHSSSLCQHPRTFVRAFSELLRTHILKQTRLRIVEWVVTYQCNAQCLFCYATKYHEPENTPLTLAEIESVWRECEKQGAFISVLEGGEPTLRADLDDIIMAMHPQHNIIVLVTNSILLSEAKIKHYRQLGVSVLHLSLDGASPQINDQLRNTSGHFQQVLKCVEWAKRWGFSVYFSSVLRHSNKREYEKILNLAKTLGIGVSGALLVTQGRYAERIDELNTEEDRKWLMGYLLQKYAGVLRFDWNTNYSGRYECPAGREKISISLYGEVMACVCNHLSFGNVRQEPLRAILQRMNNFSYFKERNERCLVGFDTEYCRKYIEPIRESKKLPVNIFAHPTHPAKMVEGIISEG